MGNKDSKPDERRVESSPSSRNLKERPRPKLGEPILNIKKHLEIGGPETEFAVFLFHFLFSVSHSLPEPA
jgi:hypothetical protein